MAAKSKTIFKLPHWCPNCRVYIESFEGGTVGGLKEIEMGLEVALDENVQIQRRCGACGHVYALTIELAESKLEMRLERQQDGSQTIVQTAVSYKSGERRPVVRLKGGIL